MASSEVDIYNAALIHLGEGSISAFTDNTNKARAGKRFYPLARDSALVQAHWTFATTQKTLSRNTETPLMHWTYKYDLPTDPYCLKPLFIEKPDYDIPWEVKGRELYIDEESVKLEYIFRQTDVSTYNPIFELYMSYLLAGMVAYTITGHRTMVSDMYALAEDTLDDAASSDAQVGISKDFATDSYETVRR